MFSKDRKILVEYSETLRCVILEGLKKWQKENVINQLKNAKHFNNAIKKLTELKPKLNHELYNKYLVDSK